MSSFNTVSADFKTLNMLSLSLESLKIMIWNTLSKLGHQQHFDIVCVCMHVYIVCMYHTLYVRICVGMCVCMYVYAYPAFLTLQSIKKT